MRLLLCALFFLSASNVYARQSFMPENNLHILEAGGGLTEKQFNDVIDRAEALYKPQFEAFGANLTIERRWSDATVNAYADQPKTGEWQVHMFGGLARRPEVTEDGFALTLGHELGHHLGGFPFVQDWAANEGQSDMYATSAYARKLFSENAFLSEQAESKLPANMKAKCDARYLTVTDRDICYRSLVAGKSLADLLGALHHDVVKFDTPDTHVVKTTDDEHPAAQCRLDTYVASALCGNDTWDYGLIPGKSFSDTNSMEAQKEAYEHSCSEGEGARPRCWFAPVTPAKCPSSSTKVCRLICKVTPQKSWCKDYSAL